ncbi:hypothetical protein ACKWTF_016738 [Chironomus riparius]
MVKRCCAKSCYNSQFTHKIGYFGFPKNEIVAREWARLSGRDDLVEKKIDTLIKYYLCSDHFTQSDFANPEIEDKSFLTLNRTQNFVPLPSKFENNLQQNVEVVVKNAEKFMKIPKKIFDRKTTKPIKRKFSEKLQKVEILRTEILETDIEIQRIEEYPTEIEYIEEIILVCRLCTKPECELLSIFNENGELSTETECFKLMPATVIQFNDGLPQHVCFNCLEKLQSCANIIDGFVMNQNVFGS